MHLYVVIILLKFDNFFPSSFSGMSKKRSTLVIDINDNCDCINDILKKKKRKSSKAKSSRRDPEEEQAHTEGLGSIQDGSTTPYGTHIVSSRSAASQFDGHTVLDQPVELETLAQQDDNSDYQPHVDFPTSFLRRLLKKIGYDPNHLTTETNVHEKLLETMSRVTFHLSLFLWLS